VTRVALGDASGSIGHTLSELDLRGRTGATVLAVRRGGESIVAPSGDDPLQEHDVLLLTGTHAAVEAARELLSAAQPPVRDEEVRQTRAFRVAQARRTAEMNVVPAVEQPTPDAR
jgi:CPA2 family monovalent cation:H+ antiporter-2